MRSNEIHGKHYFFISKEKFRKMIAKKEFLEYARVLGNYYGTSINSIESIFSLGYHALLNIDWQGARLIRKKYKHTCSIFILPPSKRELMNRLVKRNQDEKKIIKTRMLSLNSEIVNFTEYDYLLINDDFLNTVNCIKYIIKTEQLRTKYQKLNFNKLIYGIMKSRF